MTYPSVVVHFQRRREEWPRTEVFWGIRAELEADSNVIRVTRHERTVPA